MEGLRKTGSCKTMQLPVSLKEVRFLGNDYIGAHTPVTHQQHKMKRPPDASLDIVKSKRCRPCIYRGGGGKNTAGIGGNLP